jgi:hypothetical protein
MLCSLVSNKPFEISVFEFIHTMNLNQLADKGENEIKLLAKTQNEVDLLWKSLLRTTGSTIVVAPRESDWLQMNFEQKAYASNDVNESW